MRVLVACEFSGRVRDAFISKGHTAISCDLLPTEAEGPHYQGDVMDIINDGWDLLIAHPPCTYLSIAAKRVWNAPGRGEKREAARKFFMSLIGASIEKICVENPVGWMNTVYRKPDQIIHPYYFGDPFQKRTCLWLKNLPKLKPSKMLPKPESTWKKIGGWHGEGERSKARSKTFLGVAEAMATQWGA